MVELLTPKESCSAKTPLIPNKEHDLLHYATFGMRMNTEGITEKSYNSRTRLLGYFWSTFVARTRRKVSS